MARFRHLCFVLCVVKVVSETNSVSAFDVESLPVYCRTMQKFLDLSREAMDAQLDMKYQASVPGLGAVAMRMYDMKLGEFVVKNCTTSLDGSILNISAEHVRVSFDSLQFSAEQVSWPSVSVTGISAGYAAISLTLSLDVDQSIDRFFRMEVTDLNLTVTNSNAGYLNSFIATALDSSRPLVTYTMSKYTKSLLDWQLESARNGSKCDALQQQFDALNMTHWQFRTATPVVVDMALTTIDVRLNSTHTNFFHNLQCDEMSFDGRILVVRVTGVDMDADFVWDYEHHGSSIWMLHNKGAGTVNATGALDVYIDMTKPASSAVTVGLPSLRVSLNPESDVILYKTAVIFAMPMVRRTLEIIANTYVQDQVVGCLRNASCLNVPSNGTGVPPREDVSSSPLLFV